MITVSRLVPRSEPPTVVATVACPTGTTVLSAGFSLYSADRSAVVHSLFPDVDVAGSPASQGVEVVAGEIDGGSDQTWAVYGHAICAA